MSDAIVQLSDDSFEEDVIKSDKPVLVDFWAEWCGPCKMVAPILDDIAEEHAGIPTLLLFKDGDVIATKVGALSRAQLIEFLEQHI